MMPEASLSVIIAVIGIIFSAGLTWGLMTAKTNKIEVVVDDLKTVVAKLQGLSTDTEVMKAINALHSETVQRHEARIAVLELTLAKFQAQP